MAYSQENFIGACANMHIWFELRAFTQRKMQNDQHGNFVRVTFLQSNYLMQTDMHMTFFGQRSMIWVVG